MDGQYIRHPTSDIRHARNDELRKRRANFFYPPYIHQPARRELLANRSLTHAVHSLLLLFFPAVGGSLHLFNRKVVDFPVLLLPTK